MIRGLGLVLFDSGWVKILGFCEHGSEILCILDRASL